MWLPLVYYIPNYYLQNLSFVRFIEPDLCRFLARASEATASPLVKFLYGTLVGSPSMCAWFSSKLH